MLKPRTKLLPQVRDACRARQYSPRTEDAYVGWIRRFIIFHGKRHPAELGSEHVAQFLTDLATNHRVSAATQNQAASLRQARLANVSVIESNATTREGIHPHYWVPIQHWGERLAASRALR